MGWFEALLAAFGLNKVSVVAGGVGAAIAALKAEGTNWVMKVVNFTAGFFLAGWGTAIVIKQFELPMEPTYLGGVAFAMGYLGMSILDAATLAAGAFKTLDFKAIIQKALGKVGL